MPTNTDTLYLIFQWTKSTLSFITEEEIWKFMGMRYSAGMYCYIAMSIM